MSVRKLICCIGGLLMMMSCAVQGNADVNKRSKYNYCNVHLETACFGIIQGDVLTMQLPADYLLYDVKLHSGGNVLVYYGFNPKGVGSKSTLLKDASGAGVEMCSLYKVSDDQYRIIYRPKRDDFTIDVYLDGVSYDNYKDFNDFLLNFRSCKADEDSIICSDNKFFRKTLIEFKE